MDASIADHCGSYERGPSRQVALEHGEPLMFPDHFDHVGPKLGGAARFDDRAGRYGTHHTGSLAIWRGRKTDGDERRVDAVPLHGISN